MKHLTQLAILIASVCSGSLLQGQVPTIISQPASQTVAVGTNFTEQVIATGVNLTYQWWLGSSNMIATGTNSTYVVSSATYSNAGAYSVVVTSGSGAVTSSVGTVTVLLKPTIVTNPVSTVVASGTPVTLSVSAAGDSLNYQWAKDGTNINGATAATYAIPGSTTNDSGTYTVVAANTVGTATSSGAVVQFLGPPVITTPPTNAAIPTGVSYTLVSAATGGYLSYQWAKGGVDIPGATNATLNLPSPDPAFDAGVYRVTVSNLKTSVTASATISIYDTPVINTQPLGTNVATNTSVTLTVAATPSSGGGAVHYQWLRGTNNVGADSPSLVLAGTLADSGTYTVVVSNQVGKVTSAGAAVLYVGLPAVATQPSGFTNASGSTITLNIGMSNAATSLLNYQWKVDTGSGATNIPGATASSLVLSSVDSSSSGTYSAVVTNLAGSVTSGNAVVLVQLSPAITNQPQSTNAATNHNVTLSVTATGDSLSYQWYRGSTNITGSNGTSLVVTGLVANSGSYSVVVSNLVGHVNSASATVLFVGLPQITTQPADKGAKVGDSVTFTVGLTNASTSLLKYQWWFGSSAIPGATTNSLTVSSIVATNAGNYVVVVTNLAGGITSSPAVLTVETAPAISVQPVGTNIAVSSNLTLSVTASGGLLGYQWKNGSNVVVGATGSTLLITNAQTTNSGLYTVTITNAAGSVTSDPAQAWVVAPPVFVTNLVNTAVLAGSDYTMSVAMQDAATSLLTYQWYITNSGSGWLPLDGLTTSSIFFPSIGPESDGDYIVVVTNVAGAVTSAVATLTVQAPPAIVSGPLGTNVASGTGFALSVNTTGDGLFYQWLKNGANIWSGFGSNSVSVSSSAVSDSGVYSVVVSNLIGKVTSGNATVTVVSTPVISGQPAGQTLYLGNDCTFSVAVNNAATSLLNYQWYFGSNAIVGATSSTLLIPGVTSANQGNYSVIVTNLAGAATSSVAFLMVVTPPAITSQPQGTNVAVGSNIVMSVTASGQLLTYDWFRGAVDLHANTNTLVVSNAQLSAAGTYTVTVSNALGKVTSSNAVVQVVARPAIKVAPVGGAVRVGTEFLFSVVASNAATSLLSYQWVKDGTPISGATGTNYDILTVASSDSGVYTVVITNLAGAVTSAPVTLTVQAWPVITSQPVGTNVASGNGFTLAVGATGDSLNYIWMKGGSPINGAGNAATFNISNPAPSDSGTYSVVVSNQVGTATSIGVSVLVVSTPVIQTPPVGGTVIAGNDFTFTTAIVNAAYQLPNYQWMFNSNAIPGATSSSYTLQGANLANSGYYQVVVTNLAGAVSNTAVYLQVQKTPVITVLTGSTNVGVGTNFTLSVSATGNGLSYQWMKGITNLPSSLNTNWFTNLSAAISDSGTYSVVVSNTAGKVASPGMIVQVVAKPVITNQTASQVLAQWSDCIFSVSVANAATSLLNYQWMYNSNAIAGGTNATLEIPIIDLSDAGYYHVIVTNIAGAATSTPALLTVDAIPMITAQPQGTNSGVGTNLTLSVAATGNSLAYQWKKGTNAISGATGSSYVISALALSDSGTYTVVVSNVAGTVTSYGAIVQVVDAPLITNQPVSRILAQWSDCTFSVGLSNAATSLLSYQWYFNSNVIASATNSSYTLRGIDPSVAGLYYVIVTNLVNSVRSSNVTLTVETMPTISVQPQGTNLGVTTNIVLSVTASGNNLAYQWRKGITNLVAASNIIGVTNSTLTITNAQISDSGVYSVFITNDVGSVASASATVQVVAVPIIITNPPASIFVAVGDSCDFGVVVTNAATSLLSYQWRYTNAAPSPGTNYAIDNATSDGLEIGGVAASDAGGYYVVVTNVAGAATSSVLTLVAQVYPFISSNAVTPVNLAKSGGGTNLIVGAGGDSIGFNWFKDGVALGAGNGGTTSNLTIVAASTAESGTYTMVVTNAVGAVTSAPIAVLVVDVPQIAIQPAASVFLPLNAPAYTLSVGATGGLLTYQWSTNGVNVAGSNANVFTISGLSAPQTNTYYVGVTNIAGGLTSITATVSAETTVGIGTQPQATNLAKGGMITNIVVATGDELRYQWLKNGIPIAGANSATNTLVASQSAADDYSVIVTNDVSAVTSSVARVVVVAAPAISVPPVGGAIIADSNTGVAPPFTFSVQMRSTNNQLLNYQWYYWITNGANNITNSIANATNSTYTIAAPTTNDTTSYCVIVTNLAGGVTSSIVNLQVQRVPHITVQPLATNVVLGTNFTNSVGAIGEGIGYVWLKGTNVISSSTSSNLVLSNVQLSDSGAYRVIVTNAVGSDTSAAPASLLVVAPPVITSQPIGRSLVSGFSNFTFRVAVSNASISALSYRWLLESNAIPSATTNSYTLNNLTTSMSGNYSVEVSNIAGVITSSIAVLTVQHVPTVSLSNQPRGTNVGIGTNFSLTVTAGGEGLGYQWAKDGLTMVGQTNNVYTNTGAAFADAGVYTVTITNAVGSVISSNAVVNVLPLPVITTQPVGQYLVVGTSNYTFRVAVSNAAANLVSYQWYSIITNTTSTLNVTTNSLTLTNLTTNMTGQYLVTASNVAGVVTSSVAVLTVQNLPGISSSLSGTNIGVGTNFSLTVTGTGEGIGYQWSKDGTVLVGQTTNTYTNASAAVADSGTYSVTITNGVGSVTSNAVVNVLNVPVINADPLGRNVPLGSNYTFSVSVTNTSMLTYFWQFRNLGGTSNVLASGASSSYRLPSVHTNDAGDYSVIASNVAGTATSAVATLVVLTKPTLVVSPASTNLATNGTIILGVQATGNALLYQWYKGTNALAETSNTLTISNAATSDSGSYRVIVSNDVGTTNSAWAVVNVVSGPVIATQPQGKIVAPNTVYTFSVLMNNLTNSLLNYQWIVVTNNPAGTNVLTGAVNSTLRLTSITTNNAGDYYVVVTNLAGGVTSAVATLTVQTTPTILTNPASGSVVLGSNITLNVSASGIGIAYQWTKGKTNIVGANNPSLVISNAQISDSGTYAVVVTNTIGSVTSSNAIIYVVDVPVITSQPQGRPVAVGNNYTFSVGVSNAATSALSYQWIKNTTNIPGATGSSLALTKLTTDDTGDYSVIVTNVAGGATSSIATLTVMSKPAFDLQPTAVTLAQSSNLTMTADATGGYVSYIWRKGTTIIPSDGTGTLTITNARVTNSGIYTVMASNSVGTLTSSNINVLVVAPPTFASAFTNTAVGSGSSYTFSAVMSNAASSALTYQWFVSNTVNSAIEGATNSTLKLSAISTNDAGLYTLLVTNVAGAVSNLATLSVQTKMTIITNLASTNLAVNGTLRLGVVVTNGTPSGYIWHKGNTVLAGANTATLVISNVVVTNSGTYSVTVSNAAGVLTSSNAAVLVVALPAFQKQPTGATNAAATNGTYTFSVTMSNAANSLLSYQWIQITNVGGSTNVTNILAGATTNTLKLIGLSATNSGTYQVIVTNLAGGVTSSPAILSIQTKPVFTNQPVSTNIAVGTTLVLSGGASGSSVGYQWRKGTANIRGSNAVNLTISTAKLTDSGTYTLIASNQVGLVTSTNAVVLVVAKPGIQTQPQGKSLVTGNSYTMSVVVSNAANSALSYQWWSITNSVTTMIAGATTNSLTLTHLGTNNAGQYMVVVTNVAGGVTSSVANIIVQSGPVITNQPAGTNLIVGHDLTLSVGATGDNLAYKWLRGTNFVAYGIGSNTITITAAQITNSGVYTVTITNNIGKVVSSNAIVNVVDVPVILTNLVDSAVAVGSNYTFKVTMASATNALLHYQWFFNGNLWPATKATNNTLALTGITAANQGLYQVVITNIAGAVTSSAYLTVQAKPVITTQPAVSTTVIASNSLTLNVVATGDALVYQWQKAIGKGFTNIAGANSSSLSISSAATNDAGSYSVVISNLVGSVTSAKAAVIVLWNNGTNWVKYTDGSGNLAKANASKESFSGAGDYTGLFVAASGIPTHDSAGVLTVSVTSSGSYSGRLVLAGDALGIAGQFDADGNSSIEVARPGKATVTVTLVVTDAKQQLNGSVSASDWTSVLTADRSVFSSANASPNAGSYKLVIPATNPADGLSATGSVRVNVNGSITFVGVTSEGTTISQSTTVSKDGFWPFYVPYGDGEIIGWLQFKNGSPVGTLNWIESTGTDTTVSEVVGSGYSQ